ncbi:precorrin-6B methylase 1 [Clostridium beijerinckii]|nr:precorrin-6B methylase 1 [Clostridium beijerinckii]
MHKEKVRCKVVIGENLSYEDEIITNGTPEEFMNKKYDSLSVFIVDRTSR